MTLAQRLERWLEGESMDAAGVSEDVLRGEYAALVRAYQIAYENLRRAIKAGDAKADEIRGFDEHPLSYWAGYRHGLLAGLADLGRVLGHAWNVHRLAAMRRHRE